MLVMHGMHNTVSSIVPQIPEITTVFYEKTASGPLGGSCFLDVMLYGTSTTLISFSVKSDWLSTTSAITATSDC